jgi:transposase, IS5 family
VGPAGAHRPPQRDAPWVEYGFAVEKCGIGLVVRMIGLARATATITPANLAYNMRRLAWSETRSTPA